MSKIDWSSLLGRTFETIKGARFTVVRVTPRYVTIRPEKGLRDYALSIPNELERVRAACASGPFFPSPTELPRIGVRPVLASYVWGVMHAVMEEQAAAVQPAAVPPERIAGDWQIVEMAEFDERYFRMAEKRPFVKIESKHGTDLRGEYAFGLSNGYFDGALREFGGEQVFVFGYEGSDEMDQVFGCGWLRLAGPDELEGEFVSTYGSFTARRDQPKQKKRRREH